VTRGHISKKKKKKKMPSDIAQLHQGMVVGDYVVTAGFGSGSYGSVARGRHMSNGETVAIKAVNDCDWDDSERRCLAALSHSSVLRLLAYYELRGVHYLVTELAEGGDLFDFLDGKARVAESVVRPLFVQLVKAMKCVHSAGVIHRDLKLENIFLDASQRRVIIGDWGFATFWSRRVTQTENCGTLYYLAPELVRSESYTGPEVDVWSLGVLLYYLIVGRLPFDAGNTKATESLILKGRPALPRFLSASARDLLSHLLVPSSRRLSVDELLCHPWLTGRPLNTAVAQNYGISSRSATASITAAVAAASMPLGSQRRHAKRARPSPTAGIIATSTASYAKLNVGGAAADDDSAKRRRTYRCGKCGQPKRGHICGAATSAASSFRAPPSPVAVVSSRRSGNSMDDDNDSASLPSLASLCSSKCASPMIAASRPSLFDMLPQPTIF
jgi:serine/threonine protein kinase